MRANLKTITAFAFCAVLPFSANASAVITNGTISLGVNDLGQLNFGGVGIRYNPTGNDGIQAPAGCDCEGWGAAIASTGNTGYANNAIGTGGLSLVSFASTASTAVSVTNVLNASNTAVLQVTHNYHPLAGTPNLYAVDVSIKNISGQDIAAGDLRYRRVMDWDVAPTAFNEYVTVQGVPAALGVANNSNLLGTSIDGFSSANPLSSRNGSGISAPCAPNDSNFTDCGADDLGALFDFDFDALADGATLSFSTYYGAAASEADADLARALVDGDASDVEIGLYSYGQPSSAGGADLGIPNTFIFGFLANNGNLNPPTIPEPGSLALAAAALAALTIRYRQQRV